MKKIMSLMMVMLTLFATANAQKGSKAAEMKAKNDGMTNEELANKRVDGFIKKFAFPAELKTKLYPLFLERIQTVRKAKDQAAPDKTAIQNANQKFKTRLQQVLSPDQYAQVKKAWDEAKAKHQAAKGKDKGKKMEKEDDFDN